jgi:hypothetical protein
MGRQKSGEQLEKRIYTEAIVSSTLTFIITVLAAIVMVYFIDWHTAPKPIIQLTDIRVSPTYNPYYISNEDLIPTSTELLEKLQKDIRCVFIGLNKYQPYSQYYTYLKMNRNLLLTFDSEKQDYLQAIDSILKILKQSPITENDQIEIFNLLWYNASRFSNGFAYLINSSAPCLDEILKRVSADGQQDSNDPNDLFAFVLQTVDLDSESKKVVCRIFRKKGTIEVIIFNRQANMGDYTWAIQLEICKALAKLDTIALIPIFEKFKELYTKGVDDSALKEVEREIDRISRWEIDILISNEGDTAFAALPYASLFVTPKSPTNEKENIMPLEVRQGYNVLNTQVVQGNSAIRITFTSTYRVGEDDWYYDHFNNRNAQCRIGMYTSSGRKIIYSNVVPFEPTIQVN